MKDAYYFSHDSNAHKDTKCIRLRRLAGMAGYGLFWCIIEMLRDAPEFKISMSCAEDILYELRCDQEQWNALFESGLIKTDGEFFWSESLLRRMSRYLEKREQRSKAGKRSAEARSISTSVEHPLNDNSTSVEHPLNESSTESNKVKESKVKESKRKKTLREIDQQFLDELAATYSNVNMQEEIVLAKEWIEDHPGRKFSRSFLRGWIKRSAEKTKQISDNDNWDYINGGHKHVVL